MVEVIKSQGELVMDLPELSAQGIGEVVDLMRQRCDEAKRHNDFAEGSDVAGIGKIEKERIEYSRYKAGELYGSVAAVAEAFDRVLPMEGLSWKEKFFAAPEE